MLRLVKELEDKEGEWGQILKRTITILQSIQLSWGFGMIFRQEKAAILQQNKVGCACRPRGSEESGVPCSEPIYPYVSIQCLRAPLLSYQGFDFSIKNLPGCGFSNHYLSTIFTIKKCLWNNRKFIYCLLPPVLGTEFLKPCNFLSEKSIRGIFCSNIWLLTLVPDVELLNPLEFTGW